MKLTYNSKFEPGDTVYTLLGWLNGPNVKTRQIVKVLGVNNNNIQYELTPLSKLGSTYFNNVTETAIYKTKEQAEAVGIKKRKEYEARKAQEAEARKIEIEREYEDALQEIKRQKEDDLTALNNDIKRGI